MLRRGVSRVGEGAPWGREEVCAELNNLAKCLLFVAKRQHGRSARDHCRWLPANGRSRVTGGDGAFVASKTEVPLYCMS